MRSMMEGIVKGFSVGVVGIVVGLTVSSAEAQVGGRCSSAAVRVGPLCMDKYEASVWETTDASLIAKIKGGTVTLTDLTTAGAIQRGVSSDDYDAAGCPDTGNGCVNVYAVSITGVTPSRFINWFQAVAAARNSDKRLPTNAEWQVSARGTPDPGASPGTEDCNTNASGPDLTGTRANCKSDARAFDMVGNLDEWVAEWLPRSTNCPGWESGFSDDAMCLAGADTTSGPGAIIRGGRYSDGTDAGVFSVDGTTIPTSVDAGLGFRAARVAR